MDSGRDRSFEETLLDGNGDNRVSLLFGEDMDVSMDRFSEGLAAILEITPVEARMFIRRSRGIFLESLSPGKADQIEDLLGEEDIELVRLDQERLVPHIAATRARQFVPTNRGLGVQVGTRRENIAVVPWSDIDIISAGILGNQTFWSKTREDEIDKQTRLRQMGTSVFDDLEGEEEEQMLNLDPGEEEVNEMDDRRLQLIRKETDWVIDVICYDETERFRWHRSHALFSYLRSKQELEPTSRENMRKLVISILLQQDNLVFPPLTVDFCYKTPNFQMVFSDSNEFVQYTRWFLTLYNEQVKSRPNILPGTDYDE